jgi:uncharacterized protein YdeI (BOF family)
MKALVVALALFAMSSPAFAQDRVGVNHDSGASAQPSDARNTGDVNAQGERLVCRSVSDSSTSRMARRRVCHTEAEWRAIMRAS